VLAAEGIEPRVVLAFDNVETIKRAVEIDAGVAILPEPTVQREVAAGTLCSLPITTTGTEDLVRPLGIIRARGKPLSPTVKRFIDLLHGHARDLDASTTVAATAS
jgi:DNA-binding transcriptional LysR family regulator